MATNVLVLSGFFLAGDILFLILKLVAAAAAGLQPSHQLQGKESTSGCHWNAHSQCVSDCLADTFGCIVRTET